MPKLSNLQKLIILVVVVVVAALIMAVYFLYFKKPTVENVAQNIQQIEEQKIETPTTPVVQKSYTEIVNDLEKKVKAGTITANELIDLGVAYYNLGELDKAEVAYAQSIAKDPNNAIAYGNLGNIYRDKSEFAKAEQNYKKALQIDPNGSKYYIALGFIYFNFMDNKQGAVDILNQGLVAIPGNQEIKSLLGEYQK